MSVAGGMLHVFCSVSTHPTFLPKLFFFFPFAIKNLAWDLNLCLLCSGTRSPPGVYILQVPPWCLIQRRYKPFYSLNHRRLSLELKLEVVHALSSNRSLGGQDGGCFFTTIPSNTRVSLFPELKWISSKLEVSGLFYLIIPGFNSTENMVEYICSFLSVKSVSSFFFHLCMGQGNGKRWL